MGWRISVLSPKNLKDPPIRFCNISDPPSPPSYSWAVNWQYILYSPPFILYRRRVIPSRFLLKNQVILPRILPPPPSLSEKKWLVPSGFPYVFQSLPDEIKDCSSLRSFIDKIRETILLCYISFLSTATLLLFTWQFC